MNTHLDMDGRHQRWPAIMLVVAMAAALVTAVQSEANAAATHLSYIVNAHPDNEGQTWSLIEGATGNFKAFMYLTTGEETTGCASDWFEANTGEAHPLGSGAEPYTFGRGSNNCYVGRRNSTRTFMQAMASTDSLGRPANSGHVDR